MLWPAWERAMPWRRAVREPPICEGGSIACRIWVMVGGKYYYDVFWCHGWMITVSFVYIGRVILILCCSDEMTE